MTGFGINGKEAQNLLDTVSITLNKNAVPYETLSPFKTSGVRVGSAAITSRGFKEAEAVKVAGFIIRAFQNKDDQAALDQIKAEVIALTDDFQLYAK